MKDQTLTGSLPKLSAPAMRALANQGITTLQSYPNIRKKKSCNFMAWGKVHYRNFGKRWRQMGWRLERIESNGLVVINWISAFYIYNTGIFSSISFTPIRCPSFIS